MEVVGWCDVVVVVGRGCYDGDDIFSGSSN